MSSAPAVSPTLFPANVPAWRRGFEWAYRYEAPDGTGTYVWSVDREQRLDGVPYWVIKAGTREIFYRASDLASGQETVDGIVVVQHFPPRLNFTWPLVAGARWEQSFKMERPRDRQTNDYERVWTVDPEESVVVPAGTFRAVKIVQRAKQTGALINELWYAPEIMNWVKLREVLTTGTRSRELISYSLR